MSNADTPAWAGWHRPRKGQPWLRVAEADSEDGAWRLLLAVIEGGEKLVLPGHQRPDQPKGRRG
jgi:hypothetical protein